MAPLWVDEAESSINALTILEHGYPTSSYLGAPIYENTLVEPWPESEEFEFRDSSYSKKGIAVYHGWVPLYAIAASFAAFGVHPDSVSRELKSRFSPADWRLRTIAARTPSVLFGIALMLSLFWAGKTFGGIDTAWAALILSALLPTIVDCNRQARYYSATLLFSTIAALLVWKMAESGKWRWFALGGVGFVLLFHSHMIAFAAVALLFAARLPKVLRAPGGWAKTALFGAIVFVGVVPWALAAGLLDSASALPKAYSYLQLTDVIGFPLRKLPYTLVILGGLTAIFLRRLWPAWLPPAAAKVVDEFRRPYLFLVLWLGISYCTFIFLIPAASFFWNRMPTVVGAPAILLMAMVFAEAARALRPGGVSPVIAAATSVLFVLPYGVSRPPSSADAPLKEFLGRIQQMRIEPGTKLYALPNNHLVLAFYTGLPFESVAPVRKSYLDRYPGRILIADVLSDELAPNDPAAPQPLLTAARTAGVKLSGRDAKRMSDELATYDYREAQLSQVCRVSPAPVLPPYDFARTALERQRRLNAERLEGLVAFAASVPVTRGIPVHNMKDIWCAFFYRFVDPLARMGPNLNYAGRLETASLSVVGDRWALYDIPPKEAACQTSHGEASRHAD